MERSQDWLDEAHGALEHARSDPKHAYYNWACSSVQQAAEKAVKAVFQKLGAEAWGHAVADLLRALPAHLAVPPDLVEGGLEARQSVYRR